MSGKGNRRIAGSYFVSTLSISLVLMVLGILVFILLNAQVISNHVKQNIGFSIIVRDGANEAEVKKMQKIIDTKPFVTSSVYISKEEAASGFKQEMGEDFEQVLGYNPLLPSIDIKLNPLYANNDSLEVIEKNLMAYDVIQEVYYQKSLVHIVNENVKRISFILLLAGAALVLISFTLIRNTIHLSIYSQRFLIKTMQLVGAKPFFICKPFVQNSVWFGFFGSMLANMVLLSAVYFLQREVGGVIDVMNKEIIIIMVVVVMASGIVLSFISSWMSVLKYLNKDVNELYN